MPRQLVEKANLLEQAGYAYNYHRMMYVNRTDRKAFSVEFLDDNTESRIMEKFVEPKEEADTWEFYTSSDLSEGIRRELNRVLQ